MRTDEGTAVPGTEAKPIVAASPLAATRLHEMQRQTIDHGSIEPWPGNPRTQFDPQKIDEYAESIAVNGVLQNIVVRPHPKKPGRFEIAAGESRWRAVQQLVKAKRAVASYGMPCLVKPLDDRAMLELALTENVQRKDLTALEEAHAFKRLVDMKVGTDAIAARVGCSRRHVQLRLALVDKLHPKAQAALSDGTIGADYAREITRVPHDLQADIVKALTPNARGYVEISNAQDLRRFVQDAIKGVAVGRAWFDRALYKGEVVKDEETGTEYFADAGQFHRLQKQVIDARKAELLKKWKWVEQGQEWGAQLPYQYQEKPKADKAGALLIVDRNTGKLHVREGVIDRYNPKRGGPEPRSSAAQPQSKQGAKGEKFDPQAFDHHVAKIKTNALRVAIINGDQALALRLAIASQLGGFELYAGDFAMRDANVHPIVRDARRKFIEPLDVGDDAKLAQRLSKMTERDLAGTLAAALADSVSTFSDGDGDAAETLAIAALAGADVRKVWSLAAKEGESFLALCSSKHLAVIAAQLGVPPAADAKPASLRALRAAIHKAAAARKDYLPPWLEWRSGADLEKTIAAWAKAKAAGTDKAAPAKPAAKAKAKSKKKA